MKIKFVKTHPDAQLPKRNIGGNAGTGDSGYDLYSVEDIVLPPRSITKVNVGLQIAYIPAGYWIRIESRSGLYFKHKIDSFNGIVDQSYRGILGVALTNHSEEEYHIKKGDRIAQFVVYDLFEPEIEWAEDIEKTQRGESGFGSSGN